MRLINQSINQSINQLFYLLEQRRKLLTILKTCPKYNTILPLTIHTLLTMRNLYDMHINNYTTYLRVRDGALYFYFNFNYILVKFFPSSMQCSRLSAANTQSSRMQTTSSLVSREMLIVYAFSSTNLIQSGVY